MAKISIAMTTYNGEKYVEKQLLSLLNQTRKADEVIIRDDCSADRTAEIVNRFIRENSLDHWVFTVNRENLGYKRNFYEAISQTTGDIIFLCDQDDIWLPEKLATMEKIMEGHPEIQALSSSFEFMDEQDKPFSIQQNSHKSNQGIIRFLIPVNAIKKIDMQPVCSYNISPGCTTAFTKAVKENFICHSKCKIVHDWEINFAAACMDGLYFYNHPLIQYRIHTGNALGLSVIDGSSVSKNGGYNRRLSDAHTMFDVMNEFENYKVLMDSETKGRFSIQRKFVAARLHAIQQKSIWKVLKLYRYRKNYRESITQMGRLADIVCVILPIRKRKNGYE